MRFVVRLLPLAAILALAGCSLAEDVTPPPGVAEGGLVRPAFVGEPTAAVPNTVPDPESGAAIFAERCAPCHGPSGLGDGAQSANLPVAPARLGDPTVARAASLADWYQMVTVGNIDRFMPGFQSLSDEQRWDVSAYALTLSVSPEEIEQGRVTYEANRCTDCHSSGGAASALSAALLADRSGIELFEAITAGTAEGQMPAYGDSLSEADRWALVAYLRNSGTAPAEGLTPGAIEETQAPEATLEASETSEAQASSEAAPTSGPTPTAISLAGTIRGQVINGTEGEPVPSGLQVTLHGLENAEEVFSETATVESGGEFAFGGLEIVPGRLFNVSVDYAGVTYESDLAHLVEGSPVLEFPLTVYEATSDPAGLSVAQLHLILSSPLDGFVRGFEVWVFSNSGDRAIHPADGEPLLEVVLPEGAVPVQSSGGEALGPSANSPNGFLYSVGVPPGVGTAQLAVVFDVPFDERLEISQPVEYPIESVVLLTEAGGLAPRGGDWEDLGAADFAGVNVEQFSVLAPAVGEVMSLTLVQGSTGGTSGDTLVGVGIGVGVLGAALILAGLWWFRRREAPASEPVAIAPALPAQDPMGRESLLQAIAALDDDFEAGKIGEDEYRARRQALKQRVLDPSRGGRD